MSVVVKWDKYNEKETDTDLTKWWRFVNDCKKGWLVSYKEHNPEEFMSREECEKNNIPWKMVKRDFTRGLVDVDEWFGLGEEWLKKRRRLSSLIKSLKKENSYLILLNDMGKEIYKENNNQSWLELELPDRCYEDEGVE